MSDFVITIPSYKRPGICRSHTLKLLEDQKINPKKIFVFVADNEAAKAYEYALKPGSYNEIVVGVPGLVQQREFIMSFWPPGQKIVSLDDDITDFDLSLSEIFKGDSMETFFTKAFATCEKTGAHIWGVYPCWNAKFRQKNTEITHYLRYLVGAFYGFINEPHEEALKITICREGNKEDVERTIKYFIRDGQTVRFNRVGFQTKYYGSEGGLGTFKARLAPMKKASYNLLDSYSQYGRVYLRRSGMTEFKLHKLFCKIAQSLE